MNCIEAINVSVLAKDSYEKIARKIYLTYPTHALMGDEERQFEILDEISNYFAIPIFSIQVVGSAKTGKSFHKQTPFIAKTSDLDIAIIDPKLFINYTEYVFRETKGFNDRTKFPIINGESSFKSYSTYVSKGIFRPDLMSQGEKRASWYRFFGQLSKKHHDIFKSINAGIYLSQIFFEQKQRSNIQQHITNKAI